MCAWVCASSAACVIAADTTELASLRGLLRFSRDHSESCEPFLFCRCQMCLHHLPRSPRPLPLVPAWAQGLKIGASGLQKAEHSSSSVQPREVQPCLGRCICSPRVSRGGERANPGCLSACRFSVEVFSVGAL